MSDALYVQMLRQGEVVHIVSIEDEWWLKVVEGFTVNVFRRPLIIDHQVQVAIEQVGQYACGPTIKKRRTTYLFGNAGISEHAILVESLEKVSAVPTS